MKNLIPILKFWNEYKAYSIDKPIPEHKEFLESSLIRVLCWYRKKLFLNLIWLIPLLLFSGMVIYSIMDEHSESMIFDIIDTCLSYGYNMDMALILLQSHCLMDVISEQKNIKFCDILQHNNTLSLYNWN